MIEFIIHSKGIEHTVKTQESDIVKRFLKSFKNEKIPYSQWNKCSHENNIKYEINEK